MMTKTASIGTASLVNALKNQNNYYRFKIIRKVEPLSSGCYSCPNYNINTEVCNNCPSRIFESVQSQEKEYVNEKNKYGNKPSLKIKALELFLYLHFLSPDQKGLVFLDTDSAATTIGCTKRTIRNNLNLLQKYEYIVCGKGIYPGSFQIFIKDYEKNFLPATQGGRGYIHMTDDFFSHIIKSKNINELRLMLRSYLGSVLEKDKGTVKIKRPKTYQEIKHFLPGYCTNKSIRKILKAPEFTELFDTAAETHTYDIHLKAEYDPTTILPKLKADCMAQVKDIVVSFNEKHPRHHLKLSKKDFNDISAISLKYPIFQIKQAVNEMLHSYVLSETPIKKPGALIRTICQANELHYQIFSTSTL